MGSHMIFTLGTKNTIHKVKSFLNSLVHASFAIANCFLTLAFKFLNTFIYNTVKMSAET